MFRGSSACSLLASVSMSHWPSLHSRMTPQMFLLTAFLLAPATAIDLGSVFTALTGGNRVEETCSRECSCATKTAEKIVQGYVTRLLPDIGVHMRPTIEEDTRSFVTTLTAWVGSMGYIQCQLPKGAKHNLTYLLGTSPFSFKGLQVKCDEEATIVWDISSFNLFIHILDFSGCTLEAANEYDNMGVPANLWILDLDRVNPDAVKKLDFSLTSTLWSLRITNSSLNHIPRSMVTHSLPALLHLNLANNKLVNFKCEMKLKFLSSLNLKNNFLTKVPDCVIDGSLKVDYISVQNNQLSKLENIFYNVTEEKFSILRVSYLNLAYNNLTYFGKLRPIKNFMSLDVSNNHLIAIDEEAFSLHKSLAWIDFSNNMLHQLPDGLFSKLTIMEHLNVSHNYLRVFSSDQSPVSSRTLTLDVRHNRLLFPPFDDTGYIAPRFIKTKAAYNPFKCDCNMGVFLEFLTMINTSQHRNWFAAGYWSHEATPKARQPYLDVDAFVCNQPPEFSGVKIRSLNFKNTCPLMQGCPVNCHCKLIKTGFSHVFVNCSLAKSMSYLPTDVPIMADKPLVLEFSGSGLRVLDYRPYLRLVAELYASGGRLQTVTAGAMQALENASVIALNDNHLRSLPSITFNLTFVHATNISLHGNPWTCGCQDLWMPSWMALHAKILYEPTAVRCRWTGKPVNQFSPKDLSCGMFNFLPLLIALFFLLGIIVVLSSVLLKFRLEALVFLYTRFRIRPFDMFRYDKKQALFDVFVSFSQHDTRWVIEKLMDQLENRENPYRLCIHFRDFPVGVPIADNIAWAVDNSRCTLLVLTRDFLSSEWCRHEFRMAHARLLKDRNSKLLIIVRGPLDARNVDRELRAYIRTHTFLRTDDKWFWAKLEYALPYPQGNLAPPGPAPDPVEGIVDAGNMEKPYPVRAAGDLKPVFDITEV